VAVSAGPLDALPVFPVAVTVRRTCPAAQQPGDCNCTGACLRAVTREEEIAALRARLAELGA
jgi:hypothetical protein